MEYIESFEFTLSKNINIGKGGERFDSNILILKAPSEIHDKTATKLKQDFIKAQTAKGDELLASLLSNEKASDNLQTLIKARKETTTESIVDKANIAEVLNLIYSSNLIDAVNFKSTFKKLLLEKDIASIEGEPITDAILSKIDPRDIDKIMGEYIATFLSFSA